MVKIRTIKQHTRHHREHSQQHEDAAEGGGDAVCLIDAVLLDGGDTQTVSRQRLAQVARY